MEFVFFFLAIGVFFIFVFIKEAIQAKKQEKLFAKFLYEDFGKLSEKEYSPERYLRIESFFRKHQKPGQIDDITWNDLNMDDVFKRMNYTLSASGEEYLYYTLRTAKQSTDELNHLEEVVQFFETNKDERVKVQLLMHELGYTGKFSLYDYIDNLDYLGKRSNTKHIVLDLLFIPLIALIPFQAAMGITGLIMLIIYNIMTYFREKNEIDPYITSFAYVMRLLLICESLTKVKIPTLSEEWQTIDSHRNQLNGMRRGSFWVFSSNRSKETGNPLDILFDYLRMTLHVDLIQFNKMLFELEKHIADVDVLIENVGYVDAAISVAALRTSLEGQYCVPKFISEGQITLQEAYHPLLRDPVKNSIVTKRGVLLTGSNASGKSTFLKTVALNAILAQTIHTCTADGYEAPFFYIYSSMSLRDSIQGGESYYIVEIKALKRILDAASQCNAKVLCFVDEVLRGTNTIERIAASTQILKSLANPQIVCFAATHDVEMTDLLKELYDNYHFEEDIRDGDVYFNYKLLQGKATTRNAIKLLEIMGYDKEIIDKATGQAEKFVNTGVWELT